MNGKKSLLLSIAILCASMTALAQSTDLHQLHHNQMLQLIEKQTKDVNVAAKTTGLKERLSGVNYYITPFGSSSIVLADSLIFFYSGTHTSTYDFNRMLYNYALLPESDEVPAMYLDTKSPNYIPDMLFDSAHDYNAVGVLASNFKRRYSGDLTLESTSKYVSSSNDYIMTYNSYGNILMQYAIGTTTTTTDTGYTQTFSYNAAQQLTAMQMDVKIAPGVFTPNLKHTYTYNTAGNVSEVIYYVMQSPTWNAYDRYRMTYTATGQVQTMRTDTGASFGQYYLDTFMYKPGLNYYTARMESQWNSSSWLPIYSVQKHINTAGLPDSMIQLYPTGASSKDVYTYTALGNPLTDTTIAVNSSDTSVSVYHYLYDKYPDAVMTQTKPASKIILYPNPVADILNIQAENFMAASILSLSIYNADGRLMKKAILHSTNGRVQLSVADLAPGIYYISAIDNDGNILKMQKLIKK